SNNSYPKDNRSSYSHPSEPANRPSDAERRLRRQQEQLENILNNPTTNEIRSGKALNVVLADIKKTADQLGWDDLPTMKLDLADDAWVHFNVTGGDGSIAILKNGVRFVWPAALSSADLQEQRKQIEDLTAQAVVQARSQGMVDSAVIGPMN